VKEQIAMTDYDWSRSKH